MSKCFSIKSYLLKVAVIIEEAQEQFAEWLVIIRIPVDFTLLNHIDRRDVVLDFELFWTQLVETWEHRGLHSILQEVDNHKNEAVA